MDWFEIAAYPCRTGVAQATKACFTATGLMYWFAGPQFVIAILHTAYKNSIQDLWVMNKVNRD
jgi:hypothetical protein